MVGACATVPTADRAQDAEMKTFLAPANQARIYVVRDGGYMSGAYQLFRIIVDGRDYGPLAPWTYFAFTVDPGTHSVTASGNENQERVTYCRGGEAVLRQCAVNDRYHERSSINVHAVRS
jgi:hypothetical protein